MWHSYHGQFWGMHFMWWIFWIVFFIWIFATPWGRNKIGPHGDSPVDILKKRYARGEISKEEFEERKRVLEQHT